MFNRRSIPLLALLFTFLLTASFSSTPKNFNSYAAGGGCEDAQAQSIEGTEDLVSFNAPAGNTITAVCIKSGSNMFGGTGHSGQLENGSFESGCYTVSGVGTSSVTVERTGEESSTCQGISHIDIYYSPEVTPTPTETPSPTPTEGPTSTPTPSEEQPTPTPTSEVTPTNTPSPTSTPTLTPVPTTETVSQPTSTPTPVQSVLGAVVTSTPTPTPVQSVLGAATTRRMPETGVGMFWIILATVIMLSGLGSLTFAAAAPRFRKHENQSAG